MADNQGGKFRLAERESAVRDVLGELPPEIRDAADGVVHFLSPDELAAKVAEDRRWAWAEMSYDPKADRIFVVPDHIESPARLREVLRHEFVHRGLKRKFGKEFDRVLRDAERFIPEEARRDIADLYEESWDAPQGRKVIVEEWLARQAEGRMPETPFFERLRLRVLDWMRQLGLRRGDYSLAEINDIIARALRAGQVTKRAPTAATDGPSRSLSDRMAERRPGEGEQPAFSVRSRLQEMREKLREAAAPLSALGRNRSLVHRVSARVDTAENRANEIGEWAGRSVELDFRRPAPPKENRSQRRERRRLEELDRLAAPFVKEAAGDPAQIAFFRSILGNASEAGAALVPKYLRILDHAEANFADINGKLAGHDAMMAKQSTIEARAGVNHGQIDNYVTRVLQRPAGDDPTTPVLFGGPGGGKSRYFVKGREFEYLADAIAAGYDPKTTDIAALTRHRITTGQRLVQEQRMIRDLHDFRVPSDGMKLIGEYPLKEDGSGERDGSKVPDGYTQMHLTPEEPVLVHNQFVGLLKSLFGDDQVRNFVVGRGLLKWAGFAKHNTLLLDSFHAARLIYKAATATPLSLERWRSGDLQLPGRYGNWLALIEYSPRELARAVAAGDITQQAADYATRNASALNELKAAGYNLGRNGENLWSIGKHWAITEKTIGRFNKWLFTKLQRGLMAQVGVEAFHANLKKFPEMARADVAEMTAKHLNELFSTLNNQSLIKSKTFRSLSRIIFLAPQWAEGQLRQEARGYGQLAKAPVDAVRGRFRVGVLGSGMAKGVAAMFLLNQLVNVALNGRPTWENEDGHKLDAFIPGSLVGGRGFYFNPFEIAGEYAHAFMKHYERSQDAMNAAISVAAGKLGPVGQASRTLLSGTDYASRPYVKKDARGRTVTDPATRWAAAGLAAAPFPIPATAWLQRDPNATLGVSANEEPGSFAKQMLAGVGFKVTRALGPEEKMRRAAAAYRNEPTGAFPKSEYTKLRQALENLDVERERGGEAAGLQERARAEASALIAAGKSREEIGKAFGLKKDGTIAPARFAGGGDAEEEFRRSLGLEEMKTYREAQAAHARKIRLLKQLIRSGR